MNCPTRDPDPSGKLGRNQNPSPMDNDLLTNSSITSVPGKSTEHGEGSSSASRRYSIDDDLGGSDDDDGAEEDEEEDDGLLEGRRREGIPMKHRRASSRSFDTGSSGGGSRVKRFSHIWQTFRAMASKYAKFIGPGIMVSVAYMDPGNYSTAVSAGALYQYKLLFVVLVSNLFAVFLQILCCKLGSVTGLDLAQNCREHLPRWMCMTVYALAEIAIIATDLAEVVGTAIALNILFGVPLTLGVALTVADVLLVLLFYRPNGPMNIVRYFEYLVAALVTVVVVCFAIELAKIGPVDKTAIFNGFFLPHADLFESTGLYLSCGILGATVMPHSLYLGSGLVQPRLREYDQKHGHHNVNESENEGNHYRPSIHAIKYAMGFSIAELIISLFTVAIFVNAAILIVAGATLSNSPDDAVDADLFSIYEMLKKFLGPAAGTVFALALLFSGQSAGIVCTLSGQMVSEGFLHWSFQPWIRRLITRALAIVPCFVVSIFVGRKGLAGVLNASQVVLSLMLPFVSAPLLYFTANKKIMRVLNDRDDETYTRIAQHEDGENDPAAAGPDYIDMSNGLVTNIIAVSIFALVSALNLFLIVSMAMGEEVPL